LGRTPANDVTRGNCLADGRAAIAASAVQSEIRNDSIRFVVQRIKSRDAPLTDINEKMDTSGTKALFYLLINNGNSAIHTFDGIVYTLFAF